MEDAPTPAKPTAEAASGAAAPTPAPAAPAVHPAARWLGRLFSPMSLVDQEYCTDRFQRLLWGSLCVSFPFAYWMGNVVITMGAVCAATVVCLVLYVPNWYQHPDPLLKFADDTEVYHYYQQYEAAKKAARELAASPSPPAAKKDEGKCGGRAATPSTRKQA